MIDRILEDQIKQNLENDNKIIVLYGPRQVGKSTLVESIIKKFAIKTAKANGDEFIYHDVFTSRNVKTMLDFVDDAAVLFIDEAQGIKDIGINIKILFDQKIKTKIILTGSSALELASNIKEPLTGRTISYLLYPVSMLELRKTASRFELKQELDNYVTYGLYPEIVTTTSVSHKIQKLRELASAYLYKDILMLSNIRNSDKIFKLLQLLAYQLGQLVSIHEISKTLSLSSETVNHYIDLLEQSFVIFRLSGYSENPRKEISKMNKIYFYDLGIRNTLIDNFSPFQSRMDKGQIFENFIIAERIKRNAYAMDYSRYYFWRTYGGAEIDFIESKDGTLHGFEIKTTSKKQNPPKSWLEQYPNSSFNYINLDNYLDYVL